MSTTSMAIFSNPLFATYSVFACNASIDRTIEMLVVSALADDDRGLHAAAWWIFRSLLLNVVGRDHSSLARLLQRARCPSLVQDLHIYDHVILSDGHLVTVLSLVVIHRSIPASASLVTNTHTYVDWYNKDSCAGLEFPASLEVLEFKKTEKVLELFWKKSGRP